MAPTSTLTLARERDQLATWCRDFEIFTHQPLLQAQLSGFDLATDQPFDRLLYEGWKENVLRFQTFHEEYPFVVAPPGSLTGAIPTGLSQLADGQALGLSQDELARHVGIFGMTGAAKTTIAQQLAAHLHAAGAHLHLIDGKRDAEHFVTRDQAMLALTPQTPLPLLDRAHLGNEHARLLIRTLRRTLYGGEGLEQVATEALATTYERHPQPSLVDLHRVVLAMERKGDTYTRRDRIAGLALRLARIIDTYPGWSTTPAGEGLDLDLLRTRSWYFGFTVHTEIEDFLSTFLIEFLFARKRLLNDRTTQNVVSIDEAVPYFDRATISGDAALVPTLGLLREFQIGCIITANNIRSLPPTLKSNLYLQIVLNLSDHTEASEITKTFGLTHDQQEFLNHKLTRGTAIARLADRWRKPILATFPPPAFEKRITAAEWAAAQERTTANARPPLAAREGNGDTGWTPPSHTPTATASREQPLRAATNTPASATASSTHTVPPNSGQETSPNAREEVVPPNAGDRLVEDAGIASNSSERRTSPNALRPRVALNKHSTALLQDVGDHPFTLCTQAYRRCGLLLAQGDRARTQLERLGLLRTSRVRCGRGRGRSGVALSLTEQGWRWCRRPPTKGLRGGSADQHSFCTFALLRLIPDSMIEELLDAKSVDLAIPFNTELHEPLYRAIAALTGKTPHLENGDIIALEIEISAPSKSGVRNAAKNAAAGVALTILAVADRQPERLALTLPSNAVVVDVYALMDALRTTEQQ